MPFRFLADENISKRFVDFLRKEGYNVKDVKEKGLFGLEDTEILKLADKDKRIILTHDKDFGGILNNPIKFKRIIFIRYTNQSPDNVIKLFKKDLEKVKNKIEDSVIVLYDRYTEIY